MRALAVLLVLGAIARADGDTARARRHFDNGRALYKTQNYDEAMREFALGYELAPKPEFLLNIGQCYRGLGKWAQARDNFVRFLRDAPPNHPQRQEVEILLREAERNLAAPSPQPVAAPPPPVVAAAPVVAAPVVVPPVQVSEAPRPRWIRRNWWVIPLVTLSAAGIAVGLGVGLSPKDPCAGAGACVAVTR